MELSAKIFSPVRERLSLRCLTGFWMCLCCVCENYLSVDFPTQPFRYFLLWGDSKLFISQLFRFSMELIHLHYSWQQNRVAKIGDIFQSVRPWVSTWCPNIKKMKANKVCILWSLFILSSFPYEKVCMIIKMTTFLA